MVLDIVILVLIVISIFLGYKKGLIKLGINLVSLIISLVITFILYNPIANFVVNVTNIDETIEDSIYSKVLEIMSEDTKGENSYLGITVQQAEQGILSTAARELAVNIVRLGVFVILVVGSKIALRFVSALSEAISKLPIIDQFNEIGGAIYGLIRGLLIVFIALIIIEFITQTVPKNTAIEQIQKSTLTKIMYENNILGFLFKW